VQPTPADTAEKRRWDLASYADRLRGLSDRLLDEVDRLIKEYPDEPPKELLRKIT